MPQKDIKFTIKADSANAIGIINKEKFAEAWNAMSADEQKMVFEIMKNKKALKGLKDNWSMLKPMFS